MMYLLAFFISGAAAQVLPACQTFTDIPCANNVNSCGLSVRCIDADRCVHDQVWYKQDCTPTPRPNYCPPGNAQHPVFMVKDRKSCPPK